MKNMDLFDSDFTEESLEIDDEILSPEGITKQNNEPKVQEKNPEKDGEEKTNGTDELEIELSPSEEQQFTSEPSSNPDTFFSSLILALKEGGVLADVDEKDIKSEEDFYNVFNDAIKAREFADLTDTQKQYLEAIRLGIPDENVLGYMQRSAQYESITPEDIESEESDSVDLRRTLIMNNFMSKGFDEAKAKKLTDKIFDASEDIDEAKEALTELKQLEKDSFEEQKKQHAEYAKKQQEYEKKSLEHLNKFASEIKEIVPGIPINSTQSSKIVKGLTQPVSYTQDNRPLDTISKYLYENPVEGRFKIAYLLEITNGLQDMSKLNVKASNKAINQLAKVLNSKDIKDVNSSEFKSTNDVAKIDWDKYDLA